MLNAISPKIKIYQAFGLKIASEVSCPEFTKDCGKADIIIKLGRIPENYIENEDWAYYWSASPLHFYLSLKNIGRFLCETGNIVTVEPALGHDPLQLRIFLFGSVLGALMHQREIFPLHASAVERNGIAFVFTGDTGTGKSTLASACLEYDFKLLADDVCAITRSSDHSLLVHPAYPLVKLSQEMVDKVNIKNVDVLPPVIGSPKHRLLLHQTPSAGSQLRSIIVLSNDAESDSPLKISTLRGVKKIQALLKNIYRYEYLRPMQKEAQVFMHCMFLAQHIAVLSITGGYKHIHPCSLIRKLGIISSHH